MNRFRTASTPDELRSAVTAAGFDPDHPEITAAIAATTRLEKSELDGTDLTGVSGGIRFGAPGDPTYDNMDYDNMDYPDSGW